MEWVDYNQGCLTQFWDHFRFFQFLQLSSSELWVWEMVVMSATQTGLCLNPWKSSWMTHLNSSIHPSILHVQVRLWLQPTSRSTDFHLHDRFVQLFCGEATALSGLLGDIDSPACSLLFPYLVLLSVKGAAALRESQDSLQEKTVTKQEHRSTGSTWDICLSASLLLERDRPTEISHHCWVSNRMIIPHPDTQPTKKKFQTMLKSERNHPLWNPKYNSVVWVCALHVPVCIALKV